ncbi:MAG: flagellar biosynthesis protein FlgD [Planctomycetota bacterium]|nr:flagellar biosynthesis protein FlgD [Planctomycetota bacterium]
MTQIQSTAGTSTAAAADPASDKRGQGLDSLDPAQFLNLIITQLQNQDPLAPTDNAALMQQVGQLREITANDKLTTTLTSFSITQELTTASALIGRKINGLDITGSEITGVVDSVSIKVDEKDRNNRQVRVQVGDKTVDMSNVKSIDEVKATTPVTSTTP